MDNLTQLLEKAPGGDAQMVAQLYESVYHELRAMAARKMAAERPGHTLQPTALVNEAYLRLARPDGRPWENRAHFFGAAAEAMRRILVDSARRKRQLKRGGEHEPMELWETRLAAPVEDEKLLQVHEALDTLAREDALKAEIVKLRYFIGLNHLQIAEVLEVNEKTVRRHWELAKIKLFDIISGENEGEQGGG